MSEWTNIKDGLPEYHGTFICLDLKDKEIEWFDKGVLTPAFDDIFGCGYTDIGFYDYDFNGNPAKVDVSHWMPFPKSGIDKSEVDK